MPTKSTLLFNNKYRIPSARLSNWNYANEGMYFVTICTKNRKHYFGKIVSDANGKSYLEPTEIGRIAFMEWHKTIELRSDMKLELGEFVVMPNHIHGIIIIGENDHNRRDAMHRVSAREYKNEFSPQSKNLASIMRGYKSAVTIYARKNNIDFNWQPRFHDRIIRTITGYVNVSNYILNNPAKWNEDDFFTLTKDRNSSPQ